jgi:hypothetical protein
MNIYELSKLATPGPVDGIGGSFYEKRLPSGVVSRLYPGITETSYNTRFDAHCRNHFMEALEALRDLVANVQQTTSAFDNHIRVNRLHELIEEAS